MKWTNELYHHGVKGMSWGKRNGPPYPLNQQGRKKLQDQRIEKYASSGKAYTENLKSYSVGGLSTMKTSTGEKYVSGLIHGHDFDWNEVTSFNNTDGTSAYKSVSSVFKEGAGQKIFANPDMKDSDGGISELALMNANPTFGDPGTTQNCAKCSAALEVMQRYGVEISAGRQTYPSSVDAQSFWFKDAQRVDYDPSNVEDMLTSYGKGSSGTLSIRYPNNAGGHAMHWTVDNDGNFEIQDGQNARRFSSFEHMSQVYGADPSAKVTTFRLDTCEPNWDAMAQDSVIRYQPRDDQNPAISKVRNRNSKRLVDTW